MKNKFFLSIIFFWLLTNCFCQKPIMELSFTAKYNGQFVFLDSILIMNLTKGSDTALYGHDTVLTLNYLLAIHDNISKFNNKFSISQNFPNPSKDLTTICIKLNEIEEVEINIYDINGNKAGHYQTLLNKGNHFFTIIPGNEKTYMLTASVENMHKTIKILNANNNNTYKGICKIIYMGLNENSEDFKFQTGNNNFDFESGDQLRYIGYAKTLSGFKGSDLILDRPEYSQTYTFDITEGVPCFNNPIITYEGKVYKTVLIGNQCWMKDNLNVGFRIDGLEYMSDNGILEKYCYNNIESNCEHYGGLYRWKEMMLYKTTQGIQGICPEGWHLPTDNEWTILMNYLGGENIAGGKLKEKGTIHWSLPNTGATNESGFSALPGGSNFNHGGFVTLSLIADFWSSTEQSNSDASSWRMDYDNSDFFHITNNKANGHTVRCIKD